MQTEKEVQVYSYVVNIQSVKMKVKFPCKMKLEYTGQALTPQVSQNQTGKFIFNQEVTLKQEPEKSHFEIVAHLATDKGAKYIAGVIRLAQSELVHQEGQMMVVHLAKCLDSDACCELRVDQVSSQKVMQKVSIQKVMAIRNREFQNFSPKNHISPSFQQQKGATGTKSQFQFPLTSNRQLNPNRIRQEGYQSIFERPRSPNNNLRRTNVAATYIERNLPQFGVLDISNRDKLIEAQVYKQSYQKLKQKYKKQAQTAKNQLNKRMALENNENNFKLEIMRLKLRSEQQQKTITDKNTKIKQMQLQLASLQKKQLDLNYLRQQASNKEHTIRMLEDTIRTLNRDNEDLKALNRDRFEGEQQKIRQLRNEIEITRQKHENRFIEVQRQLKLKVQIISQKDTQIRIKEERIQREQRLVDQLEKVAQTKSFEYERAIQNQQNEWKSKSEDFKQTIERLEKEKSKLQQELQSSRTQHEKIKSYIIKIEYDKKILSQETDGFKTQLTQLKNLKDKHQQLMRDHRLLTEDRNHLQRQYEKTLQTKDSNISELSKQHQQQIQHYRKIYKQVQQKMRNAQNKILQLQSQFEQKKNEAQKLRRSAQSLTRQSNDLKQKQKTYKKTIKLKEQQVSILSAELESSKYKSKNGDQLIRYELQNLREQLNKTKRDLDNQTMKSVQLTQKLSNLNSQLSKTKLQYQSAVDQNQKDTTNYKQKISSLENYNRQYEKKVDQLNNIVNNLRNSDKENQSKIQKSELQGLKTNERIQKLQKEIRILEDKAQQYENQLKNKQNQIVSVQNAKQAVQRKLLETQDKLNTTKNNFNVVSGQKNKNDKIIQLLNRDINDNKQQIDRQSKMIQSKQKQQQQLRNELKKSKQQYLKLQMKSTAVKKQYDRFKDHLLQTLSSTFSQIPLGAADLKASAISIQALNKKGSSENIDSGVFNAQILNKVNSQNKDIKVAMTKLIEHNKLLQKQIERISEQGLSISAKNQLNELSLNKRIEQLQDQIQKVYGDKQDQNMRNKASIQQLQVQLEERENLNKQLILQVEELNFTVNSIRMDQQASTEHSNLKHSQLKSRISQLEEKVNYLTNSLNQSEAVSQDFESRLTDKTTQYQSERDASLKKDKQIQAINDEKRALLALIQQGKRQRKQLLQRISQLELRLSTEIELKQKGRSLLEDEERKGTQLKQFVANLMKQKQMAIKGDLQKSEQIIKLQGSLLQATRERQMQGEEIERMRRSIEEQKQIVKKLNNQVKDLQSTGSDEKGRVSKLTERLRQRQRQLKQIEQSFSKLKVEYEKLHLKSTKTISQLQTQLQEQIKQKDIQIQLLTQKLSQTQKQLNESETKTISIRSQLVILQQSLFMERQAAEVKAEEANKLIQESEQLRGQLKQLQENINNLNQEIRDKEENMFQLSGKVYQLESRLEAKENQKNQKLTIIIEDWSSKYDNMADEYQQRIDLVEKEKNYFKERLEEKEQQYRKIVAEIRNNQLEDAGLKKALEEKIKRLEQERLALISSKNSEIQRLAEDNKTKFEILKSKEADLRRLQHELEVARSTISKLEQSKRQTEQKIRSINKHYQSQLEVLKKRQASSRNSVQQIERIQWDVEREVKRTIQTFSKRLVSNDPKEDNQKLLSTMKGLEDEVVNAISNKLNISSN